MAGSTRKGALHRLTTREVFTATDGDHTDGGGLMLRVRLDRKGAKGHDIAGQVSWVFRFSAPTGERREMGLGVCERHNLQASGASLAAARLAAAKARAMLAEMPPRDPIAERACARAAALEAIRVGAAERAQTDATLARIARQYHARVIEPVKSAKHGAQWISSLERLLPRAIWQAPIASITAPVLLDAMIDLYRRVPETASRIRQRLDVIFADAQFHGVCLTNPAAAIKPKLREAGGRHALESHRALPYAQAPAFVTALRAQPGIAAQALEFGLLTAARTGEIIGATWSEIDTDAAVWTVPAARMKGGEEHRVHLSARALAILERMREIGGGFVFPNPRDLQKSQSNMGMLALIKRMKYQDRTTAHGVCRATFSTWANELGIARPDVIEACLAHREGDRIRAAYNRAKFGAERRALLDAWSAFVTGMGSSNVVPIRSVA